MAAKSVKKQFWRTRPAWTRHFISDRSVSPRRGNLRLGYGGRTGRRTSGRRAPGGRLPRPQPRPASSVSVSDTILLENFDPDYVQFERATHSGKAAWRPESLSPSVPDGDGQPNTVALGIARVMAQIAHLDDMQVVPIREIEGRFR